MKFYFGFLASLLGPVLAKDSGLSGVLQFDPSVISGVFEMMKQKYDIMDHKAAMRDFHEDSKGLEIFKMYFDYCDEAKDKLLTPEDDAACTRKLKEHMAMYELCLYLEFCFANFFELS